MTGQGRKDRSDRLTKPKSGAWASSSADFLQLLRLLAVHSSSAKIPFVIGHLGNYDNLPRCFPTEA